MADDERQEGAEERSEGGQATAEQGTDDQEQGQKAPPEEVVRIKGALEKERRLRGQLEKQLKSFKDIDPERAREALRLLDEADEHIEGSEGDEEDGGEQQKQKPRKDKRATVLEQRMELQRKQHEQSLSELKRERDDTRTRLDSFVKDSQAVQAMSAAGVRNMKLLKPHLLSKMQVEESSNGQLPIVRVLGEDGEPILVSAISGSTDPTKILEEYVTHVMPKEFPEAFPSSGLSGGGMSAAERKGAGGELSFRLSREDAQDPRKYRDMRERAHKHGKEVEIID